MRRESNKHVHKKRDARVSALLCQQNAYSDVNTQMVQYIDANARCEQLARTCNHLRIEIEACF